MKTRIVEATNGINWGRFLVGHLDVEWSVASALEPGLRVLRSCGASPEHLWVLDLVTREGACFRPGGCPPADLQKHQIHVCPLFEPFLEWLYLQDTRDLDALPALVNLPGAPAALWGYRRPGPGGDPPAAEGLTDFIRGQRQEADLQVFAEAQREEEGPRLPQIGDRLEMRWGRYWRAGKVINVGERFFLVRTDGGPKMWREFKSGPHERQNPEWRWPTKI